MTICKSNTKRCAIKKFPPLSASFRFFASRSTNLMPQNKWCKQFVGYKSTAKHVYFSNKVVVFDIDQSDESRVDHEFFWQFGRTFVQSVKYFVFVLSHFRVNECGHIFKICFHRDVALRPWISHMGAKLFNQHGIFLTNLFAKLINHRLDLVFGYYCVFWMALYFLGRFIFFK